MPNFSTASKVLATIRAGDAVNLIQSRNRVKILDAANCIPPLTDDEAKELGIKINTNFGGLLVTLTKARSQLLSAFLNNANFFQVKLPAAPAEHQADWEAFITQEINRPLRDSLSYFELHRSRWSSVVTHGIGPMMWMDDDKWLPTFVAMADLRIATDTTLDFKNLSWFARRVSYSPFELTDQAFNKNQNNHWDTKAIATILKSYEQCNTTDALSNYNWNDDAEKIAELWKQNGGFYGGDAMPSIPLWHFYFQDTDKQGVKGWYMRVVPESQVQGTTQETFLWTSETRVSRTWQELVHCQYGDLSTDAPFKYHSVRGLGYALLEPWFYENLTFCRGLQHAHDNFNIWLRSTDPIEKARAQVQEFANVSVVRSGLSIIPQTERHQIDPELMEAMLSKLKQLQGEASSSYTQATDNGTAKEQTAFETRVKTEQVNAMMSGILLQAFKYESYADKEIARRFCLKNSSDPDIIKFQARCKSKGIPPEWLDIEQWEVEPVTPLGMGNPTIAMTMVQQLMEQRGAYSPQAQNEILHEFTLVTTKDPRKAARWVPLDGKTTQSDASREAIGMFGTLMTGVPVPLSQSNLIDQIDALMPLFAGKIVQITQRDNMASVDEATGLQNVSQYLTQAIQQLSQDEQAKAKVKQYGDSLGKLNNEMKGIIQRGQQAAQAKADQQALHESLTIAYKDAPPDVQRQIEQKLGFQPSELPDPDVESNTHQMAHELASKTALHQQDAALNQERFQQDQQRANETHRAQQERDNASHVQEQARKDALTTSELARKKAMTEAEIEATRKKSAAQPKKGPVAA